jgi:hypothetical protein
VNDGFPDTRSRNSGTPSGRLMPPAVRAQAWVSKAAREEFRERDLALVGQAYATAARCNDFVLTAADVTPCGSQLKPQCYQIVIVTKRGCLQRTDQSGCFRASRLGSSVAASGRLLTSKHCRGSFCGAPMAKFDS